MAYHRIDTTDGVTRMNKALYDNLQDGLDSILDINPDSFDGTDYEKLQLALDKAIECNLRVYLTRTYDITGHTLLINKDEKAFSTNRNILFISGSNGRIKKTDSGFIFSAIHKDMGDIFISYITIESKSGVGTVVFDCDKLIRIKSNHNKYKDVDCILQANTRYSQSNEFLSDSITGGIGFKFSARYYIDTTIMNCLIEYCDSFIRNFGDLNEIYNSNLRIINNVIEDLTGTAVLLCGTTGLIFGNYFEGCGKYIDMSSINETVSRGLSVVNNTFSQGQNQVVRNEPCIVWGNIQGSGVTSIGNSTNGILHHIDKNTGCIVSIGDNYRGNPIGYSNKIYNLSRTNNEYDSYGNKKSSYGNQNKIFLMKDFSISPNEDKEIILNTEFKLSTSDEIHAHLNDCGSVQIIGYSIPTSNKVKVLLRNTSNIELNRVVYVYVYTDLYK